MDRRRKKPLGDQGDIAGDVVDPVLLKKRVDSAERSRRSASLTVELIWIVSVLLSHDRLCISDGGAHLDRFSSVNDNSTMDRRRKKPLGDQGDIAGDVVDPVLLKKRVDSAERSRRSASLTVELIWIVSVLLSHDRLCISDGGAHLDRFSSVNDNSTMDRRRKKPLGDQGDIAGDVVDPVLLKKRVDSAERSRRYRARQKELRSTSPLSTMNACSNDENQRPNNGISVVQRSTISAKKRCSPLTIDLSPLSDVTNLVTPTVGGSGQTDVEGRANHVCRENKGSSPTDGRVHCTPLSAVTEDATAVRSSDEQDMSPLSDVTNLVTPTVGGSGQAHVQVMGNKTVHYGPVKISGGKENKGVSAGPSANSGISVRNLHSQDERVLALCKYILEIDDPEALQKASGLFVLQFMRLRTGERIVFQKLCREAHILRARFFVEMCKLEQNECADNIPEPVKEILDCIRVIWR
ncbi:hypothetical protein EJB05_26091, partial [Eragrostis curvula]